MAVGKCRVHTVDMVVDVSRVNVIWMVYVYGWLMYKFIVLRIHAWYSAAVSVKATNL